MFSFLLTALLGAVVFYFQDYFKTAVANVSIVLNNNTLRTEDTLKLREENRKLYGELSNITFENYKLKKYEKENLYLKKLLDVKGEMDFETVTAQILSFGNGTGYEYVLLDRGTVDGVSVGDCVISADGFAGIVHECGYNWCGVKTLMSESLELSVTDTENGKTYLFNCGKLEFVSLADDVGFGDLLVSSGNNISIPKGLKVGRVFSVKEGKGAEKTVKVTPLTKFSELEFLLIITGD